MMSQVMVKFYVQKYLNTQIDQKIVVSTKASSKKKYSGINVNYKCLQYFFQSSYYETLFLSICTIVVKKYTKANVVYVLINIFQIFPRVLPDLQGLFSHYFYI